MKTKTTRYGYDFQKRFIPGRVKQGWILVVYFYKWYWAFANFPINK